MNTKQLTPLKGFTDRYPEDMALLNYLIDTVKSVADLCGFQQYDGPLVEPLDLYVGKTNQEILREQAFTLEDRKGRTLMLRPEMTPSLARMIAAKSQELPLPIRYFNIGQRFRYEAPQRGRNREFYQMDFDIIGSSSEIAEIEILNVLALTFQKLGATEKDFVIYINSRSLMNEQLSALDIDETQFSNVFAAIDKQDKITEDEFTDMLAACGLSSSQQESLVKLFNNPEEYSNNFSDLMQKAKIYGIDSFIQVNPAIVRGFDYYTGLVLEVKSKGTLRRSLLGGGRYDNLVGMFNPQLNISGVGFAISDTVMFEFLKEIGKLPQLSTRNSQVLVTVFDESTLATSLTIAANLRQNGIGCEVYPDFVKLQKQLTYANKANIPLVLILGPDEISNGSVTVKNMQSGEQVSIAQADLSSEMTSQLKKLS